MKDWRVVEIWRGQWEKFSTAIQDGSLIMIFRLAVLVRPENALWCVITDMRYLIALAGCSSTGKY